MRRAALLAAAALAAFLHLRGLGATALWQDEAETAVLARRVLSHGLPKADDGLNLVSQNSGRDADARGLWSYTPWLALYAAAPSIALLGPTSFAARLPFALCALGALALLFVLSRRWSGSERVAALAVLLTLASVPWLLHARQCRWYALAALLTLYLWRAYEEYLAGGRRARLHVVVSALLLFHANFLVFFAVAGGVLLHFLAAEARRRPPARADLGAAALLFLLLAPGMAYFRVFARAGGAGGVPVSHWENLRELAWGLDAHVFPFLALAGAAALTWKEPRLRRPLALLAGTLPFLVAAPHYFFRYLVVLIPLAAHLMAELAAAAGRRHALAGAALAAALVLTNLPSAGLYLGLRSFLKSDWPDFLAELRTPPKDAVLEAARVMEADLRDGDAAFVSYPDLPFMYHTRLAVVGGAQGPRRVPLSRLKWVVVRDAGERAALPLDWSLYEPVTLDAPDRPWGHRPDPGLHIFRDPPGAPRAVIYRRR